MDYQSITGATFNPSGRHNYTIDWQVDDGYVCSDWNYRVVTKQGGNSYSSDAFPASTRNATVELPDEFFPGSPLTIELELYDAADVLIRNNPVGAEFVLVEITNSYPIGAIPDQNVWHDGTGAVGFFVLTDDLGTENVILSYEPSFVPQGEIIFNAEMGGFLYFPDKNDVRNFTVTFTAKSGGVTIATKDVLFTLMVSTPPEYAAWGLERKKDPPSSGGDSYTIVVNNEGSFSVSGKELVFDGTSDKLKEISGAMSELNLYAEKLTIREALHFPQTKVTIYANELVFEGDGSINTSPLAWDGPVAGNGAKGGNAGDIELYIKKFTQSSPQIRFIQTGGKGQDTQGAVANRTPGNGGDGGKLSSTINVGANSVLMHGGSPGIQAEGGEHIPLTLVFSGYHSMNVTETNGEYNIITTGGDPYIMTSLLPVSLNASHPQVLLRFQYKSSRDISDAQFFFAQPYAQGEISTPDNIVLRQADEWTDFELDITSWCNQFGWGQAGHRLRFDPGDNAGKDIDTRIYIRNIEIKTQATISVGLRGSDGSFDLLDDEFAWLHPNWVSAVVKHAKDAYRNLFNGFVYNMSSEYSQEIENFMDSDEWNESKLTGYEKMELNISLDEMRVFMFRINQNLDFFGNPVGWVPMLSFELNRGAFQQEIDRAIRVMYLNYWLTNIERSEGNRKQGYEDALALVKEELEANSAFIVKLESDIDNLQEDAEDLEKQLDDLIKRIESKYDELMEKAKNNIEKQKKANTAVGILKVVAKVAPVLDFVAPGVGTGISMAASVGSSILSQATGASDIYGYADAVGGFMDAAGNFNGGMTNVVNSIQKLDFTSITSSVSSVETAYNAYNNVSTSVGPLVKSVQNMHKAFTANSAPNEQIQAELNKIAAESTEFQELIAKQRLLNEQKLEFMHNLETTINQFASTSVAIQSGIAAADGLRRGIDEIKNNRADHRAMQYLDDMDRRAKERLLKYHYYMAKSYEYRLLRPYTETLDLTDITDEFIRIAEKGYGVLDRDAFKDAAGFYDDLLSKVNADIWDYFNENRPKMDNVETFRATESELAMLNAGIDFNLNIFERGIFGAEQENIRIINLKIDNVKVRLEGNQNPDFASFNLYMQHSGRSLLLDKGEILWFDHITNGTADPIIWGSTYNVLTERLSEMTLSKSSIYLLFSSLVKEQIIPDVGKTNIEIFSRPSAWADIRVSKSIPPAVNPNTKMVIEELQFELQYEFVPRPSANRNLKVYTADVDGRYNSLTPLIEVSRPDIHERSHGRSPIIRTYDATRNFTVTAPENYGRFKFDHWERNNVKVSDNPISVSTSNDVTLTAYYKYTGAVLSIADTIFISSNGSSTTVKVENIGMDEMKWKAVSNNAWLQITAGSEGTDDGSFTLKYDANTTGAIRTGTLTIDSEDSETYETKTVYVVQTNETATAIEEPFIYAEDTFGDNLKVYPNPFTGEVHFIGAEGCTLQVSTVVGVLVYSQKIINSDGIIRLENLPAGMYVFRFEKDGKTKTIKVLKN